MNHPKARHKNLVVQEVQDEILVYDLDALKALGICFDGCIASGRFAAGPAKRFGVAVKLRVYEQCRLQ